MRTLFVGTGSYVPHTVTNEELFDLFHTATNGTKPIQKNGELVKNDWPKRYFGINSRTLNLNRITNLSDTDLVVKASESALQDSGIVSSAIGTIIHISQTPDEIHFQSHLAKVIQRLGLQTDIHAIYLDLGCCALGPAFREVQGNLLVDPQKYVLLVSSQCVSPVVRRRNLLIPYLSHPTDPFAWLQAGTVFSDGSAAAICKLTNDTEKRGVLRTWYASDISGTIASFKDGCYLMNARYVKEHFVPTMHKLFLKMVIEWDQYVYPVTGQRFSPKLVERWYFHQANALMIHQAVKELGIPENRVPLIIQTEGNISSASTLRLLDLDRKQGSVHPGDLVVFFWTGAGNGAQYGYSVMVV